MPISVFPLINKYTWLSLVCASVLLIERHNITDYMHLTLALVRRLLCLNQSNSGENESCKASYNIDSNIQNNMSVLALSVHF